MTKLYWCPRTRSSRVVWMLEELGIDYERVLVDVRSGEGKDDPEFRRASPMGKVPALADGDMAMCDSAAICLYLADRYPQAGLAAPADSPERGRFLYWMFFTPGVMEPAMAEKFGGWKPEPGRNGWGSFDLMIETLEKGIDGRDWLMGERFTAADVAVGSGVVFARMFDLLPDSPALSAYADRCLARPAYQKALALEH